MRETIPKKLEEVEEILRHRNHRHEDVSKIWGDFESVRLGMGEIFSIARKNSVHETLGRVNRTLTALKAAGLANNFPKLNGEADGLHRANEKFLRE